SPPFPTRRSSDLTVVDEIRGAGRARVHRLRSRRDGGEVGAGAGGGWLWLTSWRQAGEHLATAANGLVPVWGNRRVGMLLSRIITGWQSVGWAPEQRPSMVGQPPVQRRSDSGGWALWRPTQHELGDDRPVVAALAEALPDRPHPDVRRDEDMVKAQQGWQRPSVPRPGGRPPPPAALVDVRQPG